MTDENKSMTEENKSTYEKNKKYRINEIFYSIQGEGCRSGTANIFIRFSGCNLRCSIANEAGFDCDTEFSSGVDMNLGELIQKALACRYEFIQSIQSKAISPDMMPAIILTGGEPALQIDELLVDQLKKFFGYVAVESNGTKRLPSNLDWVCVSPKSAEHTLFDQPIDELKYVRQIGQGIPKPILKARYYLISPAFRGDGLVDQSVLAHCIKLVKDNPMWRLSLQLHKFLGVR